MIGELKSKEVRTVRNQKVLRVTLDFPLEHARDCTVEGRELLPYLDGKVGENIGIRFSTLEDEGQMTLDMG
jgi:hypothetical protein